jgi:hypothetical protein
VTSTINFALLKIVQDKNVAGASENYYTHVVESDLFNTDYYKRIIGLEPLPRTGEEEDAAVNNLLKMLVFNVCTRMFANEPPMVSRFADSGKLEMLAKCVTTNAYPLRPGIQSLLVSFVSSIANMEKGRAIAKSLNLLDHVLRRIALPAVEGKLKLKVVNYLAVPPPSHHQRD